MCLGFDLFHERWRRGTVLFILVLHDQEMLEGRSLSNGCFLRPHDSRNDSKNGYGKCLIHVKIERGNMIVFVTVI